MEMENGHDQAYQDCNEAGEQMHNLEMGTIHSALEAVNLSQHGGLPTPGLSPRNNTQYHSPGIWDTTSWPVNASRSAEVSMLVPPQYSASISRMPEEQQEDEETVCINLLSHVKKASLSKYPSRVVKPILVKETIAVVNRILRSKNTGSEYTCHLLLSSIMVHLVEICESMCNSTSMESEQAAIYFPQEAFPVDSTSELFVRRNIYDNQLPLTVSDSVKMSVLEAIALCSTIGDMLKQKPLNGFQMLGRHESLHVQLDLRLKAGLAKLDRRDNEEGFRV